MFETDLWRSLSRDAELTHSLAGVAKLLSSQLPLAGVVALRLDIAAQRLRVVAMDWLSPPPYPVPPRAAWPQAQSDELLTWHRSGSVQRGSPAQHELLGALWPSPQAHSLMLAPLRDEEHEPGMLLLAGGKEPFRAEHEQLVARLIEPFSMALANDRRVHELKRLRETLEADRRALLDRLDRQSIVDTIVGANAGLAETMERVEQVAPTDVPVLLLGETGSGKEVVARAIHARSQRRAGPMVRVNCGAIPPGLVDSDLFGHERGSFTGAVASRLGWFERADGGTLFLDEIGELSLGAQVRLLRVLQEGMIERVGGTKPIYVDVRIVAATHRRLDQMVSSGEFREDLWYRLSVFPVTLPALRERRHDIPELATHFATRIGNRLGGSPLALSPADLELLLAYDWPGNVRELAAVIERAAILGNGRSLDVATALGSQPNRERSDGERRSQVASGALFTLAEATRAHIKEALRRAGGRIEGKRGAAQLLDVNPHTLRARMRKLGIDWSGFRR